MVFTLCVQQQMPVKLILYIFFCVPTKSSMNVFGGWHHNEVTTTGLCPGTRANVMKSRPSRSGIPQCVDFALTTDGTRKTKTVQNTPPFRKFHKTVKRTEGQSTREHVKRLDRSWRGLTDSHRELARRVWGMCQHVNEKANGSICSVR